jgi:hypothetical protein
LGEGSQVGLVVEQKYKADFSGQLEQRIDRVVSLEMPEGYEALLAGGTGAWQRGQMIKEKRAELLAERKALGHQDFGLTLGEAGRERLAGYWKQIEAGKLGSLRESLADRVSEFPVSGLVRKRQAGLPLAGRMVEGKDAALPVQLNRTFDKEAGRTVFEMMVQNVDWIALEGSLALGLIEKDGERKRLTMEMGIDQQDGQLSCKIAAENFSSLVWLPEEGSLPSPLGIERVVSKAGGFTADDREALSLPLTVLAALEPVDKRAFTYGWDRPRSTKVVRARGPRRLSPEEEEEREEAKREQRARERRERQPWLARGGGALSGGLPRPGGGGKKETFKSAHDRRAAKNKRRRGKKGTRQPGQQGRSSKTRGRGSKKKR